MLNFFTIRIQHKCLRLWMVKDNKLLVKFFDILKFKPMITIPLYND